MEVEKQLFLRFCQVIYYLMNELLFNDHKLNNCDVAYIGTNDRSFYWRLSVFDNLSFNNLFNTTNNINISLLMDELGISDLKDKKFMDLSRQKQKVNICRGFLKNQKLLYLMRH